MIYVMAKKIKTISILNDAFYEDRHLYLTCMGIRSHKTILDNMFYIPQKYGE